MKDFLHSYYFISHTYSRTDSKNFFTYQFKKIEKNGDNKEVVNTTPSEKSHTSFCRWNTYSNH